MRVSSADAIRVGEARPNIKNNNNSKKTKNHELQLLTFDNNGVLELNVDFNKGIFNLFNS